MAGSTPQYFLMWRHKGENHWDAVSRSQVTPLLKKLLESGVNPASIILIHGSGTVYWMFPQYHKNKRQLWMSDLYDEIDGCDTVSSYTGPDVVPSPPPKDEDTYGYVAPDGRYFQCGYGGHAQLARKIVGSLEEIRDPGRFLEDRGWLVILHDPIRPQNKYAIGMGAGKYMTDAQLLKLQKLGLSDRTPGILEHLGEH